MKVIVTGGAGFIGSHVVDKLLARGDSVVCLDNFNDYYDPSLKRKNISHNLDNDNLKLVEMDIRDDLTSLDTVDAIIHLAAYAGVRPSIENPKLYVDVNVMGTQNILDFAVKRSINKIVFASSSSVYGNNKKIPFSESDNVDNPISTYAATKKAGELLCYTYHHLYGLNINCMRFFTVYGPRGRPDMAVAKFTRLIDSGEAIEMYGNGDTKRDYTFVDDIVYGIVAALDRDFGYEIFNLGNSDTVLLKELISTIETHLGKKAKIVEKEIQQGDVEITYADISKAKRMLDYNPCTKIFEGVGKYIKWYGSR